MTKPLPPSGAPPRETATAVNALLSGKINSKGDVALGTTPATATVVTALTATADSKVLLMPKDANAAAALTSIWITLADGQFTINHPASAFTRTFGYAILG